MPIPNKSQVLYLVRTMEKFVSDLQQGGADFTDPDVINWLRKNPNFTVHSNKFYALMNDGKQLPDPNWIENERVDIPTSRLWREAQEKTKEKQKKGC